MKVPYRCLYNHELLILFTSQTPYQTYKEPVGDAQVIGCVEELKDQGVDALMICPQAWRTNLWHSEIDRRWQDDAPKEKEPLLESDLKYWQKAYFRVRRYMLEGKDPVALTIKTARENGIAPLFSYRMNDHHFTNNPEGATHSRFWKEHPEYWLHPNGAPFNYLHAKVREHYLSIFGELLERYDVEGFECDFMRSAWYFPKGRVEEGTELMTGLVRALRAKLDAVGQARGKKLALSVRVPASLQLCRETGLDVARWAREGLLDMINATTSFRLSQEVDIGGFREAAPEVALYGELHFVSQPGETFGGYRTSINRLTTPELYRSTALSFLDRGADGVSLFNFAYSRDHSFNEVRRKHFPGVEPPFHVLSSLRDRATLKQGSQHLSLTPDVGNALCRPAGSLPKAIRGLESGKFEIHVPDVLDSPFQSAILRIEAESPVAHLPFAASINGVKLEGILRHGELFEPWSLEVMPDPLHLHHFKVKPSDLRTGYNAIEIFNHWMTSGGGAFSGKVTLVRIDLALYR